MNTCISNIFFMNVYFRKLYILVYSLRVGFCQESSLANGMVSKLGIVHWDCILDGKYVEFHPGQSALQMRHLFYTFRLRSLQTTKLFPTN